MTIADLCLLAAVVLTMGSIMPAKMDGKKEFDNANPRDPRFYTPGLRARALGAHMNGFESFPFFATAVLLAEMRGAPQDMVNTLAVGFILARVLYVIFYISDRPTFRSVVWMVAFFCNLAIFFSPVLAVH